MSAEGEWTCENCESVSSTRSGMIPAGWIWVPSGSSEVPTCSDRCALAWIKDRPANRLQPRPAVVIPMELYRRVIDLQNYACGVMFGCDGALGYVEIRAYAGGGRTIGLILDLGFKKIPEASTHEWSIYRLTLESLT